MGYPYRHILAPVDFHDHSLSALEVAAQIARQNDGEVTLLHVVPMDEPIGGKMYDDDFKLQAEKDAARLAELAQQPLKGVRYTIVTEIGDPATAIIDTARTRAADVIVMGTHGRKALIRVLMGSVAEQVLREASCPVIAVRMEKKS
jgi:nucleotide-binding universal stress UspA family protein